MVELLVPHPIQNLAQRPGCGAIRACGLLHSPSLFITTHFVKRRRWESSLQPSRNSTIGEWLRHVFGCELLFAHGKLHARIDRLRAGAHISLGNDRAVLGTGRPAAAFRWMAASSAGVQVRGVRRSGDVGDEKGWCEECW